MILDLRISVLDTGVTRGLCPKYKSIPWRVRYSQSNIIVKLSVTHGKMGNSLLLINTHIYEEIVKRRKIKTRKFSKDSYGVHGVGERFHCDQFLLMIDDRILIVVMIS